MRSYKEIVLDVIQNRHTKEQLQMAFYDEETFESFFKIVKLEVQFEALMETMFGEGWREK